MIRAARLLMPVLLTLLASPAASASQPETIPFELNADGHLVFQISLNGSLGTEAVIDTGATYPIIDHRAATIAGIIAPNGLETVHIAGLAGVREFPVINVARLSLGSLEFEGLSAAYNRDFKLPGARNVLPALVLPHRVLDFDFSQGELLAYDRSPLGLRNASISRLETEEINRLSFVPVTINGVSGRALIDTGASVSFINSAFAQQALGRKSSIRDLELTGSTGSLYTVRILSTRSFRIGRFKMDRFETYIADPEFLASHGLQDEPVMVLGLDLLSNFRLQIDRQQKIVLLSRPLTGVQIKPL